MVIFIEKSIVRIHQCFKYLHIFLILFDFILFGFYIELVLSIKVYYFKFFYFRQDFLNFFNKLFFITATFC